MKNFEGYLTQEEIDEIVNIFLNTRSIEYEQNTTRNEFLKGIELKYVREHLEIVSKDPIKQLISDLIILNSTEAIKENKIPLWNWLKAAERKFEMLEQQITFTNFLKKVPSKKSFKPDDNTDRKIRFPESDKSSNSTYSSEKESRRKIWRLKLFLLIVMLILVSAGSYLDFDRKISDLLVDSNSIPPKDKQVVIVAINEEDYRNRNLFNSTSPLSPAKVTEIIDAISKGEPKVLGVDILTSDEVHKQYVPKESSFPVVWAEESVKSEDDRIESYKEPLAGQVLPEKMNYTASPDFPVDSDGVIRLYQRAIDTQGIEKERHPTLAWKLYELAGLEEAKDKIENDKKYYIRFAGKKQQNERTVITASQVLDMSQKENIDELKKYLKGKIVLLGGIYPDSKDRFTAPFGEIYGVEMHSTIVETELYGQPENSIPPAAGFFINLLMIFIFIVIFSYFGLTKKSLFIAVIPILVLGVMLSLTRYGNMSGFPVLISVFSYESIIVIFFLLINKATFGSLFNGVGSYENVTFNINSEARTLINVILRQDKEYYQMSFISKLKTSLINEKSVYDLSQNKEFSEFDFIGYRETTLTIDFVAFVNAEDLTENQIVSLRDKFFNITQNAPHDFALKPAGRNPNGLLIFVFENDVSENLISFIEKQSKISHSAKRGAVMVSWSVDVNKRKINTHNNPVSWIPPVIIFSNMVFPGLDYLESFVNNYKPDEHRLPAVTTSNRKEFDAALDQKYNDPIGNSENMNSKQDINNLLQKRLEQLEDNISKDLKLLKEYEELIRTEEDPKRKLKYRSEIEALKFSASKYTDEYNQLKQNLISEGISAQSEPAELNHIQNKLDELLLGQSEIRQNISETQRAIIGHYTQSERQILLNIIEKIDQHQAEITSRILERIDRDESSDIEVDNTINKIEGALVEIEANPKFSIPQKQEIMKIINDPQINNKQKLKFIIPIISFLLQYEQEIEISSDVNLQEVWNHIKSSFQK